MHPQIEEIFDDAENRYLKIDELKLVSQYVKSIPERLAAYRSLRDREIEIMQWVADQLQIELPQAKTEDLERSLKNALLMLRHCAMAMLIDQETIVRDRFINWIAPTVEVYQTQAIDMRLHQLLNQRLRQTLGNQMNLLSPLLLKAQSALMPQAAESLNGAVIG
ncbi:hypothetical protein IFO70_01780 [Phormidium tenue FACHB-886]|nr:hypothetical protein [Phormidium tenue FACHB-886]